MPPNFPLKTLQRSYFVAQRLTLPKQVVSEKKNLPASSTRGGLKTFFLKTLANEFLLRRITFNSLKNKVKVDERKKNITARKKIMLTSEHNAPKNGQGAYKWNLKVARASTSRHLIARDCSLFSPCAIFSSAGMQ